MASTSNERLNPSANRSRSTVIRLESVSKRYRLGEIGTGALTLDVQQMLSRLVSKKTPAEIASDPSRETKRELWALKDISFDVEQGEVVAVIGGNGAGKSTLLKLLSQITLPTEGQIKSKGRIGSLLEVGTGFHPELTGRENIFLNGAILGMGKQEIQRQLDAIVDFSGCERFVDTPVKRYSTGMVVRLGFAVAAHLECEILIVDEVLAVGDVSFQRKCLGKIRELSGSLGKTVLFVSHNLGVLANLCDRGIVLGQGQMMYDGDVDKAIQVYLGDETVGHTEVRADDRVTDGQEIKLRKARLITGGSLSDSTILNSSEVEVEIEFDVLMTGESYSISIEVANEVFGPVFASTTLDMRPGLELGRFLSLGRHVARCKLPMQMIPTGSYCINLGCAIPMIKVVDRMKEPLRFDVVDDASPVATLGEPRRGVVIPQLQWSVTPADPSNGPTQE